MKFKCKNTGKIIEWEPIMINAALVSAQNRKRLFWTNIPNIEQPADRGILLRDILQDGAEVDERMVVNGKSFAVTASYNGAVAWSSIEKKQRTMVRVGQLNQGGQSGRTGLYAIKSYCIPSTYYKENVKSLIQRKKTGLMVNEDEIIRKLTPIECERLQSLPSDYTKYGMVLQYEKIFGNIELLNNNLILWKNVLSQIAIEKKKQISVPVLCTTKDIKDTEVLNSLSEKLKNVYCVIGNQLRENGVEITTTIGIGTETLCIPIKYENTTEPLSKKQITDITEILMENTGIETLLKNTLGEFSVETKSYIISTLTNLIIGLKTSISVQDQNICVFTTSLKNLLLNSLKTEQLVSKTEHTVLISSTQRYKACGNGFNCAVIEHILTNILPTSGKQ